jgi:hypothetical protein
MQLSSLHRYIPRTYSLRAILCFIAAGLVVSAYAVHSSAEGIVELPKKVFYKEVTPEDLERELVELKQKWKENESAGKKNPTHISRSADRVRKALCDQGKPRYCPQYADIPDAKHVDIKKLSYAVAVAETSNCTTGSGKSRNNCHGIFGWIDGVWKLRTFKTTEESHLAFQKLWLTKYGDRFPTVEDARRYSAGDGYSWLSRVEIAYNRPQAGVGL